MNGMARRARRAAAIVVACAGVCVFVGGCASAPRTTVILLPDEDGHVGAVSVTGAQQDQVLDAAFSGVSVQGRQSAPSAPHAMGEQTVASTYGTLMQAQPPRAVTFVLHFEHDSTTLTAESRALVPTLVGAEKQRAPTEITVFGHADSTGGGEHNFRLSLQRAQAVADLLMQADPGIRHVDVQAFGDSMPLPGSPSRGSEPRNRRVEVQIL